MHLIDRVYGTFINKVFVHLSEIMQNLAKLTNYLITQNDINSSKIYALNLIFEPSIECIYCQILWKIHQQRFGSFVRKFDKTGKLLIQDDINSN